FPMEFRIADFRLLIAELRKSAVNNRKSSFKDDRNRDWLSTGNVEELKNAPQFQTHPFGPDGSTESRSTFRMLK
ncbi:hypothetical protein OAG52_01225, partial [Verrucomicrobia bacterium]|nr:hypothetical protein [Verrucomicrobiota bacterium]MDB4745789.1 hypothetical protein [Verrucomicrobiota bacterium]